MKKAILLLEDATVFTGKSFGHIGEVCGQLVLNTAVVGYQEMLTDPANAGKLLVLTYPLIGNYGINEKFNESQKAWVKGLVIKEESRIYSNWQAKSRLEEFLKMQKITTVTGIDTRTLAVRLRNVGEITGIISSSGSDTKDLLNKLKKFKQAKKESILGQVSVKKITRFEGKKEKIVVIDLGITQSILRQLIALGLEVILVPYNTKSEEILKLNPKGIIISNGPEDDPQLSCVIETVKEILGRVALLGISTGHLVIAQGLGAKIKPMELGHHGVNYPIRSPDSYKGEITVQNHSWIVDESSLNQKEIKITEKNVNDQTIEKMQSEKLKFISIQYYPTSPGLGTVHPVFNEFVKMMGSENS